LNPKLQFEVVVVKGQAIFMPCICPCDIARIINPNI